MKIFTYYINTEVSDSEALWIYKHINYIPTYVIISMIFIFAARLSHSKVSPYLDH